MGDALKSAWILNAIYDKYDAETPSMGAGRPPKLVQLVNCFDEAKGMVSDKFHYLVAIFTTTNSTLPLTRMRGGLLRLDAFHFETIPTGPSERILVIVVEEYTFVGAEGCPPHGDPRYIMTHGPLQSLIRQEIKLKRSTSPRVASWEATLQPEELCEMEMSTQRLFAKTWDIDQYIEDDDWQIGTQIVEIGQNAHDDRQNSSPFKKPKPESSPLKRPVGVTTTRNLIKLASLPPRPTGDYFACLDNSNCTVKYSAFTL